MAQSKYWIFPKKSMIVHSSVAHYQKVTPIKIPLKPSFSLGLPMYFLSFSYGFRTCPRSPPSPRRQARHLASQGVSLAGPRRGGLDGLTVLVQPAPEAGGGGGHGPTARGELELPLLLQEDWAM